MNTAPFPSGDAAGRIFAEYREAAPPNQLAKREWVARTADKYSTSESTITSILANQELLYVRKARQVMDTEAEIVAGHIGSTLAKALQVLDDQLDAMRWRPMLDKNGNVKMHGCESCAGTGRNSYPNDEDGHGHKRTRKCRACDGTGGQVQWMKSPDNFARLAAVDKLLKIYGAFRPEKVEVDGHITLSELSIEDINSRLRALLPKIINAKVESDSGTAKNGHAGKLSKQKQLDAGAEDESGDS